MLKYKKLIPSKKSRLMLLKLFDFLPDRWMIGIQYYIKTGRLLNIRSPKRYTEKIQWYKLSYRVPLMVKCSDKVLVREFVASCGLSHILNEIYFVYNSVDEIDFSSLPNSFVLKYNNGSGINLFINDKQKSSEAEVRKELDGLIKLSNIRSGREWAYYQVKPRIFAERMFERDENNDIPDYKFFCFNGRVEYLYVMIDYVDDHGKGQCSFYDRSFQKLPFSRSEYSPIERTIPRPLNFDQMIEIAERLATEFPHVRVDLYNLNGKIYFGELTFYPASGYSVFYPDEFDFIMGDKFSLPVR